MPNSAPYNRYRSIGGFVPIPITWTSYDRFTCLTGAYPNPGWSPNLGGALVGTFRTIDDVVTPRFRQRSAAGEIIVSPVKITKEVQTGSGTFSRVRSVNPSCSSPTTFNEEDISGPYSLLAFKSLSKLDFVNLIPDDDIVSAVNIAATRAWSDSNGHDADILQDIAEMHQTIQMFTKPTAAITSLTKAITSSRKGKLAARLLGGTVESAQNLWLQYRFGIRPLVSSVNGVVQALGKIRTKRRWTARGNYTLERYDTQTSVGSTWSTTCSYTMSRRHKAVVRAGILLEEEVTLPRSLGVDASGMLALPWELVPYSFVADWFVNVGDFLYALTPYLTKNPLASWWTVEQTWNSSYKVNSTAATNSANYTIVRPVSDSREGTYVDKTRYLALAGPSVGLKPSSLGKVLSDLRKVDGLALACQRLGSLFKG